MSEIPSGAKARLLFAYINNQAIRFNKAEIDMGNTLYQFLLRNKIVHTGSNRKEIHTQVENISASNINLGVWGETGTHKYARQKSMKIAKEVSFWTEKDPTQATLWQPTMTLSDDYMAALQHHKVPINYQILVNLQTNPRAMDLYTWLTYRVNSVKAPVSIPWESLYQVFGASVSELKYFKRDFKEALNKALPYVKNLEIEMDSKHLKLINTSRKFVSIILPQEIRTTIA